LAPGWLRGPAATWSKTALNGLACGGRSLVLRLCSTCGRFISTRIGTTFNAFAASPFISSGLALYILNCWLSVRWPLELERKIAAPHWIYDRIHNGTIHISKDKKTRLYLFPDQPDTLNQFRLLKQGILKNLRFSMEYQDA
jgi:hypothetical protein